MARVPNRIQEDDDQDVDEELDGFEELDEPENVPINHQQNNNNIPNDMLRELMNVDVADLAVFVIRLVNEDAQRLNAARPIQNNEGGS